METLNKIRDAEAKAGRYGWIERDGRVTLMCAPTICPNCGLRVFGSHEAEWHGSAACVDKYDDTPF